VQVGPALAARERVERGGQRVRVDRAGDGGQRRGAEALRLVALQIAHAREHDVALLDGREAGDARRQGAPRPAGQRREPHHVEEARDVVVGRVEVGVRVEPDRRAGAAAGDGPQAADAVAGQHDGHRAVGGGGAHGVGEPAVELEHAPDLGLALVDRRDLVHGRREVRERPREPQRARAHADRAAAAVVRPDDEAQRAHRRPGSRGEDARSLASRSTSSAGGCPGCRGGTTSRSRPTADDGRSRAEDTVPG
jgi:hypothetical protein